MPSRRKRYFWTAFHLSRPGRIPDMEKCILFFEAVGKKINTLSLYAVGILLSLMVAIIMLQVGMRYLVGNALQWPEELTMFFMAWLAFIGGGVATYKSQHISMDIVLILFRKNAAVTRMLHLAGSITLLVFAVFLLIQGISLVSESGRIVSDAMRIPMSYPRLAMPIGGGIMAWHCITNILRILFLQLDTTAS